jgi:hypothetical protein
MLSINLSTADALTQYIQQADTIPVKDSRARALMRLLRPCCTAETTEPTLYVGKSKSGRCPCKHQNTHGSAIGWMAIMMVVSSGNLTEQGRRKALIDILKEKTMGGAVKEVPAQ